MAKASVSWSRLMLGNTHTKNVMMQWFTHNLTATA